LEAASVHAPAGLHRISVPLLRLRSDDQLVALFRQGDEDAFQVIHERYRQRLFAYARQMLSGSRTDAEDALQDVFLRAYGALRADDRPVTLRAWLYKVAHNRCIDQLRRPMPAVVDLFDITRGPSLQDPLEQAERREDLRRLVSDVRRLPEQQRSALLMREMEGLTYKELSEALVVSVPAVKSLLVRARIGLVEAIEARDTACCEIRLDIAAAIDKGVRASGRARRHMRECSGCREYRTALRGELKQLNGLGGNHGMLGTLAKLLGLGGAGSGAAAGGGGAAAGGGGAALVGGGAVATKVAVIACCAAVVGGGAVEVHQATAPPKHHLSSHPAVVAPISSGPAAGPISINDATLQPPAPKPADRIVEKAAPVPEVAAPEIQPASGSTVVEQSNGGMLAPDEADDTTTTDTPAGSGTATTTSGSTNGTPTTKPQTPTTVTGTGSGASSGATSGPDGSLTGSTAPSAQGATAPGAEKTPS
jgi:RNA polymerase sigma factor (sigma-70 family)